MEATENTTEYIECENCGDEVPEDEMEVVLTYRQTLETPAEYADVCSHCVSLAEDAMVDAHEDRY